ncbi:MAG TPA: hypothetical protein VLS45_09800 [Methylomicrobium sp.]|nr:hypothetical protein [Methylomicrobium sp.]
MDATDTGIFERMAVWRGGLKSTGFEIDQLQVVIYLEAADLNIGEWLEVVEKSQKGERTGLPSAFSV